jgi:hypothetical protein
MVIPNSPKCCDGVANSSSSRDTCSVKGSFTLPLALLASEADESEAPPPGNSNGIGDGEARDENEGLWGLNMSWMRLNGLKPLRPEADDGNRCFRLDRGVVGESPDSPDKAADAGCRRPRDLLPPDDCCLAEDDNLPVLLPGVAEPGVLNCVLVFGCGGVVTDADADAEVVELWVPRGGWGDNVDGWRCCGDLCFALRLDEGVENNLLFLGLVGVASTAVSVCCREGILIVGSSSSSSSAIDDGTGGSADGGVESAVEAGSIISIPSGEPPNPWRRLSDGLRRIGDGCRRCDPPPPFMILN